MNDVQFAKLIDTTPVTVGRLRRGANNPTWPTMRLIYQQTGGQVAPNDFADFIAARPDVAAPAKPPAGWWTRTKQLVAGS